MRRLVFIPVIHTFADLGSLAESVRSRYVSRFGSTAWNERERVIEELWDTMRKEIDALHLDYPQVRIYQDGLPVCGHELQIVEELAGAGSLNHQLVLDLLRRGATLMGTEDPQLLLREYQMQRQQAQDAAPGAAPGCAPAREAADLLAARDRFVARRIAETLQDGETGLLFLGAAHRLDAQSFADIQVETLRLTAGR